MSKFYRTRCVVLAIALALAIDVSVFAQETDESSAESQSALSTNAKTASAGSSIQLETTSVTGSRELPKVLVIVPWKISEALGPRERPLASLVEEALTPVDPDVFRRQLTYYTDLKEASADSGEGSTKK